MQMQVHSILLSGHYLCNSYITGLTESMSCVLGKPCWLRLSGRHCFVPCLCSCQCLSTCKRRQFEQDQCSNACLGDKQCSIRHYVDMAPLLCFHRSLVLPDLLSDVRAILNGNMPAAVVSMPKFFLQHAISLPRAQKMPMTG